MVNTLKQQARVDLRGFKIGRTLGSGGFGQVVLGTHIGSGVDYAIKIIRTTLDPEDCKMQQQEVAVMKRLLGSSTNLIELVHYKVYPSANYLIMELALGGPLVQGYMYREESAKFVVRDITEGLKTMHRKGIIHSDIKLDNILFKSVDENPIAMIADFGLCRYIKDADESSGGTHGYMAPEIKWPGYTCGPAIDIWSLGILVWNMFFTHAIDIGSMLPGGRTVIYNFPIGKISANAESFIRDCLNGDPAKRMTALEALSHRWLKEGSPTSAPALTSAATSTFALHPPPPTGTPTLIGAPNLPRRRARVRQVAAAINGKRPNRGLWERNVRKCSFI
ncbi:kinase-like domain-containing protein [Morchella snyderi]|nr:kinase-like domain-containing protein [Morchella snyderi]